MNLNTPVYDQLSGADKCFTVERELTDDCPAILRVEVFGEEPLEEIRLAITLCYDFLAQLQDVQVALVELRHFLFRVGVPLHADSLIGTRHVNLLSVVNVCPLL
jgi:hypothetical protein